MEILEILKKCDHTLLRPDCTLSEVRELCDEAEEFSCASVCVPPCHVKGAAKYLEGAVPVCTVIGFPHGNCTRPVKIFEAQNALADGAGEIDMVVNLSMVRDGAWGGVEREIAGVREVTSGHVLKVIIETCLLTREEKVHLCGIVSRSGADFIKTSTGFSSGGATAEDVALLRRHCAGHVKIKASGGISSIARAQEMLGAGADRLGESKLVLAVQGAGLL